MATTHPFRNIDFISADSAKPSELTIFAPGKTKLLTLVATTSASDQASIDTAYLESSGLNISWRSFSVATVAPLIPKAPRKPPVMTIDGLPPNSSKRLDQRGEGRKAPCLFHENDERVQQEKEEKEPDISRHPLDNQLQDRIELQSSGKTGNEGEAEHDDNDK